MFIIYSYYFPECVTVRDRDQLIAVCDALLTLHKLVGFPSKKIVTFPLLRIEFECNKNSFFSITFNENVVLSDVSTSVPLDADFSPIDYPVLDPNK